MKNFILLIITCLCVVIKTNSQENIIAPSSSYIHRYNVILHIEDTLVVQSNGVIGLEQKYSLRLGRYHAHNHFNLNDKVGFRVLLDYDSSITPVAPLEFEVRFLDYVDGSENYPLFDDPQVTHEGGLKPIVIPPIDEDDEDGFPVETDEQQFIFWQPGEKRLIFELHHVNSEPESPKIAGVRGTFFVRDFSSPYESQTQAPIQNNDIEVYPNPIQSDLYIKSTISDKDANAQIRIYTTTGVQLYTSNLQLGETKSNYTLYHFRNPDLSPGLYYYTIQIGNKTYTKPLLKK